MLSRLQSSEELATEASVGHWAAAAFMAHVCALCRSVLVVIHTAGVLVHQTQFHDDLLE